MRIAFVSCLSAQVFPKQPVWDWIAAQTPDVLLLLGDSIYLDVPSPGVHPSEMDDNSFATHALQRYRQQLQQPAFAALVRGLGAGRCFSIWDDHDFLWNDMVGAEASANPLHRGKMAISTRLQTAFRYTLAAGLAPGSFPEAVNDDRVWNPPAPVLDTPSIELEPGLWLHLTDGRSLRTRSSLLVPESRRTLFGAAQRALFSDRIAAAPADAVHLLALGSTAGDVKRRYPADWRWLTDLAAGHRLLALSGDIHRNESDAFFTGGLPLHEATSSGAAVKDAVVVGATRRNHGLLDVGADALQVQLFSNNRLDVRWSRRLDRSSWLPL